MKLYTEEQVTKLTSAAFVAGQNHNTFIFGEAFKDITPIVLPSDEEVKEYVYDNITPPSLDKGDGVEQMYFDTGFYVGFRAFAKWMRDKIQGGNK